MREEGPPTWSTRKQSRSLHALPHLVSDGLLEETEDFGPSLQELGHILLLFLSVSFFDPSPFGAHSNARC